MSRTLKWILGILAVLVVLAIIAGGVWILQNRAQMMASYRPSTVQPNAQGAPAVPGFPARPGWFGDNGRNPLRGFGFRGPMMGGRGRFMPFMPFGMGLFFFGGLFRLIVPLLILAGVAFLFYQLGRRAGRPAGASAARPEPAPAPSAEQNPPQS